MDKQTQGVEDMLFSDVLKKWYVHVEYPGVIKKKCGISKGYNAIFKNFHRVKLSFVSNFKG